MWRCPHGGCVQKVLFWCVIFSFLASEVHSNLIPLERCGKIGKAVSGISYLRLDSDQSEKTQLWRFLSDGRLEAKLAADLGKKTRTIGRWQFQHEDGTCVLKVAWEPKIDHWLTFRLVDVTWAIVTMPKDERHIPDFEDHTGAKFRFCGADKKCRVQEK